MNNDLLPDFQKYLAQRKLAPENQIPFFAYWVSKFLRFSNARQDKSLDLRIQMFLDALKQDSKLQEWQFTQADNALNLYVHHFLPESGGAGKLSPGFQEEAAEKRFADAKKNAGKNP
jgi:hypothetical protein